MQSSAISQTEFLRFGKNCWENRENERIIKKRPLQIDTLHRTLFGITQKIRINIKLKFLLYNEFPEWSLSIPKPRYVSHVPVNLILL